MSESFNLNKDFENRVMSALEGMATQQEMDILSREMVQNPAALEYYVKLVAIRSRLEKAMDLSSLRETMQEIGGDPGFAFRQVIKKDLQESTLRKNIRQDGLNPEEDEHPLSSRRKSWLETIRPYSLLIRVAAVIIVCLALIWIDRLVERKSQERNHYVVARITEQMEAQWNNPGGPFSVNDYVWNGDYVLEKGNVEITLLNGTRVAIEAPAEFAFISNDSMFLKQGRIFATVPKRAIGFVVNTANAKVIDLGTEFGVQVSEQSETQLHVIKGKTTLVAGLDSSRGSLQVDEGAAKKISGASSEVSDVPCRQDMFIRRINSQARLLWRGQTHLDLADIAGKGNGLGTGQRELGLNPLSGTWGMYRTLDYQGDNQYRRMDGSRYIDGVFIPDGSTPQMISSTGLHFKECPPTNRVFFVGMINGPGVRVSNSNLSAALPWTDSVLYMHANQGITFNLAAMRSDYSDCNIRRFTAKTGLSPAKPRQGNARVWVLVDGQIRFNQPLYKDNEVWPIEVELNPTDQFLTLVTTDGGDPDQPVSPYRSTDSDWCMFYHPYIEIDQPVQ